MLNTDLLMASELWALATGDEFKAAVGLWCRAWKQTPPGSLPDDDRVLAAFSGAGKAWPKVKAMALRGFVKCDDGRLYHATLCDDVIRAAAAKAQRAERTKAATEARKNKRNGERDVERDDSRDVDESGNVTTSHRRDETRQDEKRESEDARAPEAKHWQEVQDYLTDRTRDLTDWEVDFLHSIKWAEVLTKPQAATLKAISDKLKSPEYTGKQVFVVKRGSREFNAWIAHKREQGLKTGFMESQKEITVPSLMPPVTESAA